MKSLRQQHVDMVGQIAADEALVAEGKHELETHRAKERLPRLRDQRATLETDIELAAAAQNQLSTALTNLRTVANRDRELSLAITHAEDALHRTQLHLG